LAILFVAKSDVTPQLLLTGPVRLAGAASKEEIASVFAALEAQELADTTERAPEINELLKSTVTVLVPCPLAIDELAGAVQLKLTPFITGTVYVFEVPAQTWVDGPVMVPGVGIAELAASVRAALVPQELDAVTERLPVVKPGL
jgi:hypothetical protein